MGDTFPVSGRVAQGTDQPRVTAIRFSFPSGKGVSIPVEPDGAFRQVVTFDEEGGYRVARVSGTDAAEFGHFAVAYRTELIGVPTVESQFGLQHARSGVALAALPYEEPTTLRIRFTDARGELVRSRLPGGLVTARRLDGTWYLPVRAFLEAASPLRFADGPERILYDERTRTVWVEGLQIMLETGMVLGRPDFRADLRVIDGRAYMDLHAMLRLVDQVGMAQRTGEFSFRISMAQEP